MKSFDSARFDGASAAGWRCLVSIATLLCSLATTAPVLASDPSHAESLIKEANRLRSQGQDQKALPLMKEAYDLAPTPRTAGQLGLCEMAIGYWLEADHHLDEALAAPAHPWVAKNRSALEHAQKNVRTHLATFSLDGTPSGAEVLANGQAVGKLPLSGLVLAEGRVTFEVRATGHAEQTKQVTVAGGAQTSLTFALQPLHVETEAAKEPVATAVAPTAPEPSPAKAPKEVETSSPSHVLPITLAVGAGAALGFGIWQHIAWQGAVDDFDRVAGCYASAPMRGTDSRCQGLYDTTRTHRTLTFVGYGVAGLLAVGAGVALWLTPSPPSNTARRDGPSLTRVAFGSVGTPVSVLVSGSF